MNIEEIISAVKSQNFVELIFSEREKHNQGPYQKIMLRHIESGFQFSCFTIKQVQHMNCDIKNIAEKIMKFLHEFRQLLLKTEQEEWHILKHGNKLKAQKREIENKISSSHDREKNYILKDGEHLPFLLAQGVMSENFLVKANMQHKFRQINRFLEFVRDIVAELPTNRKIHIVDFGCGKSYLTFAIYHYLHDMMHLDVSIHGLDLKAEVIESCNKLRDELKYSDLNFAVGDIKNYQGEHRIDMVISLHACDTATDYALFQALKWQAKVILAVPCCQHELNSQMQNPQLAPLIKYGIIKERMASLMTDSLRANMLEASGYKTQILEFIDLEHTPKNLLIRAIRTKPQPHKWLEIERLIQANNFAPTLYRLIKNYENK